MATLYDFVISPKVSRKHWNPHAAASPFTAKAILSAPDSVLD